MVVCACDTPNPPLVLHVFGMDLQEKDPQKTWTMLWLSKFKKSGLFCLMVSDSCFSIYSGLKEVAFSEQVLVDTGRKGHKRVKISDFT